jgi:hypothetical protein
MPKIKPPKSSKELPRAVIKQMTTLATSGFGLVAALAWNNVIKETVDIYIKPIIGEKSGLFSLIIYALLVTALALIVTLQLSKLEQKVANLEDRFKNKSTST